MVLFPCDTWPSSILSESFFLLLDMSLQVDLRHVQQTEGSLEVLQGIDMSEFYKSVEWDILLVPVKYNEEFYECCPGEPYPDLTFNITMRRKTLFYTVNLVSTRQFHHSVPHSITSYLSVSL